MRCDAFHRNEFIFSGDDEEEDAVLHLLLLLLDILVNAPLGGQSGAVVLGLVVTVVL